MVIDAPSIISIIILFVFTYSIFGSEIKKLLNIGYSKKELELKRISDMANDKEFLESEQLKNDFDFDGWLSKCVEGIEESAKKGNYGYKYTLVFPKKMLREHKNQILKRFGKALKELGFNHVWVETVKIYTSCYSEFDVRIEW